MPPFAALVGPTYQGPSRLAGNERCVGFYLEKNESAGAVYPWTLLPLPGLITKLTTAEGPGRGLWAQEGRCLAAQGHRLYELGSTFTGTDRGALARDDNPVTFASSGDAGDEVAIASAGNVYIFNLGTNVLSAAVATTTVHQVDYLDGFFLGLDRDTSTLRISNLLDGLTWDPTQIAQRGSSSDRWSALLVSGDYIFLFGSETSDVWYNAGSFPFPFAPVAGARIPLGIAAAWSAKNVQGVPFWLTASKDGSRSVVRANGTGYPSRVSTHAVEAALKSYATVSDAVGSVVESAGHVFYRLSFPSAGATWVYDVASGQWTEDPAWVALTATEAASPYLHACQAFGVTLVSSRTDGAIYELSSSTYTHAGNTIRRVRQVPFPLLTPDNLWIFLNEIALHMDTGIGLSVADGTAGYDPQVELSVSRDSGQTWSAALTISAGKLGEYDTQVVFNRLGRFKDGRGVVRLVMTDPVSWRLSGASFDARPGVS